jgi:hypothetical protein
MKDADGGNTTPANNILPPPHPPDSGGGGGDGGGTVDPCVPLFTDAEGDDAFVLDPAGGGSNPQLDLVAGDIKVSADGTTLDTTLTVKNLTTDMATAGGAANEYYLLWNFTPAGGTATTYFSNVEVDPILGVTYSDGTVGGPTGSTYQTANTDTGEIHPGANGTLVVHVPLANIGAPVAGDLFIGPTGQSKVLVGSSVTGGSIQPVDDAGPDHNFQLGVAC